jgi:ABC-2 type transport system ATP-binding protein
MLEINDLRKRFGHVIALDGCSFTARPGRILGLLGPNGAGKTTTLRMLCTLITPTAGEATVAGADLTRQPGLIRERIGYVAQGGGSDPQETGRRELVIQARLYGMHRDEAERRAADILKLMELEAAADRKTDTYSGGMKRRLDIGLGIIHRPQLIFLDEPTTGLDPQARARMWDEVRKLRQDGMTVFLTTHYLEEADALCDRLATIDTAASSPRERQIP